MCKENSKEKVEENMKALTKKIVTGTIAASVLLGGAGFLYTQANAESAPGDAQSAPSTAPDKKGFGFKGHGKHEGFGFQGNLVQETATLLGVEASSIKEGLQQGKTLAQIAQDKGLSEEDYLQKLTDAATQKIDAALSSGKITQEQADKHKSTLSDHLKQAIENTKPTDFKGPKGGERGGHPFGAFGKPEAVAQILGITQDELKTELKAGKSLAEIAQEKGISEDDLISKLKDSLTDQLKKYVESKRAPKGNEPAQAPADSTVTQ